MSVTTLLSLIALAVVGRVAATSLWQPATKRAIAAWLIARAHEQQLRQEAAIEARAEARLIEGRWRVELGLEDQPQAEDLSVYEVTEADLRRAFSQDGVSQ